MNEKRVIKVRSYDSEIKHLIYIMHNAFRIQNNHSLYHALGFNRDITIYLIEPLDIHPRTITFFENGVHDIENQLTNQNINTIRIKRNQLDVMKLSSNSQVVMDMYYLKEEKELYENLLSLCDEHDSGFDLVETNVSVPVTECSQKEEYSARTIRSKLHKKLPEFYDVVSPFKMLLQGEKDALNLLENFVSTKLNKYHLRNNPATNVTSELSPYLKFGFISPLTILSYLKDVESDNKDSFLEELIVRRELSYNFVFNNPNYYSFESITYPWAYQTMKNHFHDEREYVYTVEDYINFDTHDSYFNTAMKEMVHHGTMHGYMRMYWCKKIIEWSKTYEEAYKTAMTLNNYYFIDGNSPNGYTGVAWCFGKHDRAWKERNIFGKLRYMNQAGLERKFDMEEYVSRIETSVINNE